MSDPALMAFGGVVFFVVMSASYLYLRSSIDPSRAPHDAEEPEETASPAMQQRRTRRAAHHG